MAAGLIGLGITGWAVTPHNSHSLPAQNACVDASRIVSAWKAGHEAPESAVSDLTQLAPKVHDPDLSGAFRAFSETHSTAAIADIDASCLHAGLP